MIGKGRGDCQAKLIPQTWVMKEATAELQQKQDSEYRALRRAQTAQTRRVEPQVLTTAQRRHFVTQIKH